MTMDKLLAGDRVTSTALTGIYTIIALNYDGSCVIVDSDGKYTYTVHTSTLTKVS